MDGDDSTEAKVRLWFHTDNAIGYSFGVIRGIFTHNAAEDKKEAVKAKLAKVTDTDELIKLCEKALIGKECWLQVSEDDTRTYKNDKGEEKPSINRNITGYEPQPKQVSAPAPQASNTNTEASDDDVMAGF